MSYKIVLASSSPRRIQLMKSAGFVFEVIHPRNVDETVNPDEPPREYALRVSLEKGLSVCEAAGDESVIISADTIVVLDDIIFGKPEDKLSAYRTLCALSSRTHQVITAYCVISGTGALLHRDYVTTDVKFRSLARHEIESYIRTNEPMDKAGSYAIQGAGAFLVESINGSYTNVVGLPLSDLVDILNSKKIKEKHRLSWT